MRHGDKYDQAQLSTIEFLACLLVLTRAGADPNKKDFCNATIRDVKRWHGFDDQERSLINEILDADCKDRPDLLKRIYDFQMKELEEARKNNNMEQIDLIQNALVIKSLFLGLVTYPAEYLSELQKSL